MVLITPSINLSLSMMRYVKQLSMIMFLPSSGFIFYLRSCMECTSDKSRIGKRQFGLDSIETLWNKK